MYLRFALPELDEHSGHKLGIFQAAYRLKDSGGLPPWDESRLKECTRWFTVHLPVPACYKQGSVQSICWFKQDAQDCVERIWDVVWLLKEHGFNPVMLTTARPGAIVYEDVFQVAAIPWRKYGLQAQPV